MSLGLLFHLSARADWDEAQERGRYQRGRGFIELYELDKVLAFANARFRGRQDLVLLAIETDKLGPDLVTPRPGSPEPNPWQQHAPIPLLCVRAVFRIVPDHDGSFRRLPPAVADL